MKVSILVANYNYETYLPPAIDSLMRQDYQDIEIVIVDDESKDGSREIIQQLHDQYPDKIKYVFQKNTGHGGAIATAFAASTGEIIAFLDSDDLWDPQKLSSVLPIFKQDPDVVGVIHQLRTIDRHGELMTQLEDVPVIPNGNLEKLFLETGAVWFYPPTSAITLHRRVLEKLLPTDSPEWKTSPDGCLLYSAGFLGKVIPIPEILGSYRRHGSNTYANESRTAPTLAMQRDTLSRVEKTIAWLNEFLAQNGKSDRVDLANNLNYMRSKYYLDSHFNWKESKQISYKIMTWPFYDWQQRGLFLMRFWAKNLKFMFS